MKKLTFLTAILLATTTFAQIPNYVPTNGLVGWWPFNGNANDESGNGNNGTNIGGQFSTDRFGHLSNRLFFNGSSRVDVGNLNLGDTNYSYSYLNWFKTNEAGYPNRTMITDYNSSNYDDNKFACWHLLFDGNVARTEIRNFPDGYGNTSTNSLNDNQWHMIISVINRNTNLFSIYIDGIYNSSIQIPTSINLNENSFLRFGIHKWNNIFEPAKHWIGELDDIGIWNRALTDCEIKDLYNSQLGSSNTISSQTQTALDTYTWPVNNQTYTQSGTYSDTLVNAAGCDSIVTLNLTLSYTGINELNASQLVVSPNPTRDNFSITGLELLGTITSLEIKDAAGKVVKVLDPTATNFSCVGLKAGVYFLAITSNKTERVVKIIKE
jgi:hypothetical protein